MATRVSTSVLCFFAGCGGSGPARGAGEPAGLRLQIEVTEAAPDLGPEVEAERGPEPEPGPVGPPPERRAGDLVVPSPPAPRPDFVGRLRSDIDGGLSAGTRRVWVGIDVPANVDLSIGTLELFILDRTPEGLLAFYRDPYGASSCTLGDLRNCAYVARLYAEGGPAIWSLDVTRLLSREDAIEVQDIRLADGTLYFNEACQTYSSSAGGRCSALVAVDPVAGRVLWRTPPLTSNNRFLVLDRYVVCGYGFTAEPDYLHIVRRSDGRRVARLRIPTAHEDLRLLDDGVLEARIYPDEIRLFRLVGLDGDAPRIVPLARAR